MFPQFVCVCLTEVNFNSQSSIKYEVNTEYTTIIVAEEAFMEYCCLISLLNNSMDRFLCFASIVGDSFNSYNALVSSAFVPMKIRENLAMKTLITIMSLF